MAAISKMKKALFQLALSAAFVGFGALLGLVISSISIGMGGNKLLSFFISYAILAAAIFMFELLVSYWPKIESNSDRAKICASILSIAITAFMGLILIVSNRSESICLRWMKQNDEVSSLITEITYLVQSGMGIPKECYNHEGGTKPINVSSPIYAENYNLYSKNMRSLRDKFFQYYRDESQRVAFAAFQSSLDVLLNMCNAEDSSYHSLWRKVTEDRDILLLSIGSTAEGCLN